MDTSRELSIDSVLPDELGGCLGELGDLLHACVHAGANVNFVLPFTLEDSFAFWRATVIPAVAAETRLLWVARHAGRLAGTVQLDIDTPPNQPHRAEVTKLLVHPDCRRQGIGRALMDELERAAAGRCRNLLTLDTRTGDAAEPLYRSIGYETVGTIPDFCHDPIDGRLHPTTIMYKTL